MNTYYEKISSLNTLDDALKGNDIVVAYFSHEKCNVCKVLKPKIAELLKENFPKAKMIYIDTVENPDIAGQNRVFAVPTIITFVMGREYSRYSRSLGVGEFENAIKRPYNMIFENN